MNLRASPLRSGQLLVEDLYRREVEVGTSRWRIGPQRRWFVVFEGNLGITLDFSEEQLMWATQGPESQAWLEEIARDQLLKALFRAEIRAEVPSERVHELSALESRLLSMVASATEVHYEIAENGDWRFLSPAWTALTGNELASTLQQPAIDFMHPDDTSKLRSMLEALVSRNAPGGEQAVRIRCHSGEYRDFVMTGEIRGSRQGSFPLAVGGTLRDVTITQHARRELVGGPQSGLESTT